MGFWHDFKVRFGWTAPPPPAQSVLPGFPIVPKPRPSPPRFRDSLRRFGKGIGKRWFWIVATAVFGSVDIFERATGVTVELPVGVFYGGAVFSLFMAAALTYHELNMTAAQTQAELAKSKRPRLKRKPVTKRIDQLIMECMRLRGEVRTAQKEGSAEAKLAAVEKALDEYEKWSLASAGTLAQDATAFLDDFLNATHERDRGLEPLRQLELSMTTRLNALRDIRKQLGD